MASCSAHERYLVDAPVQGSLGVPAPFVSAGRSRPSHLKEFFLADYLYRNALFNIFLGLADLSALLLSGRTAADNEKIGLFCHIIGVFTAAVGDALHGFAVAQLQQLARQSCRTADAPDRTDRSPGRCPLPLGATENAQAATR